MDPMVVALVAIFLISFVVFIIFFGRLPALRNTPIGFLHQLMLVDIPRIVLRWDQRMTSGRLSRSCAEWGDFLMNKRHPTVLILFILLMCIPETMFLPAVFPTLSRPAQVWATLVCFSPLFCLFKAAYVDPGIITHKTNDLHNRLYPFDHILYQPGRFCRTCKILKPARSKHCSICGFCVGRMDHHCIFINGCVGYGNTHWFILLLISTATLTTFGTIFGSEFLLAKIKLQYPTFTFKGTGLDWLDYFNFWALILHQYPKPGSITLLTLLTTPLIWGLCGYHTYLIYAGTTTNESGKWSDLDLDIKDGLAFERSLKQQDLRSASPVCQWPGTPKCVIIVQEEDGLHTPSPSRARSANLGGEGEWKPVSSLRDVDNIYDIGFLRNAVDIFCPRSVLLGKFFNPRDRRD